MPRSVLADNGDYMNLPCEHKELRATVGEYDIKKDCRICWQYVNDPKYKELLDNETTIFSKPETTTGNAPITPIENTPLEQGPSWFQKAVNFSKAAVVHAWNGLPETPTEEQEKRLAICLVCPSNLLDYNTGVCLHKSCGCKVAIKTTWAKERCPKGHW